MTEREREQYLNQKAKRENAKEIADKLASFANVLASDDAEYLFQAMGCQHRTLQQSITRLFLRWIERVAETEQGRYDMRNEASVRVCRELVEMWASKDDKYGLPPSRSLPTI